MNKGAITITQLIGWGIAIAIPTIVASVGWSNNQVSKIQDQQTSIVQRVAVVETESTQYEKDINDINNKLDILINKVK